MKPILLPTGPSGSTGAANPPNAEVLPFKRVPDPVLPEHTRQCVELLDRLKAKILAGEESPTGLVLCVVENRGETEKSFALSVGLSRMEIVGNLYALATEITLEPA